MPSFMRRYPDICLEDHWSLVIYSLILQTNFVGEFGISYHALSALHSHIMRLRPDILSRRRAVAFDFT